jgi:hypothetical protein
MDFDEYMSDRAYLLAMAESAAEALRPDRVVCNCGPRLDEFLKVLHQELQQDEETILVVNLPWLGRISLHRNRVK